MSETVNFKEDQIWRHSDPNHVGPKEEAIPLMSTGGLINCRREAVKRAFQKSGGALKMFGFVEQFDEELEKRQVAIPFTDWEKLPHLEVHLKVKTIPSEVLLQELKRRVKKGNLPFEDLMRETNNIYQELRK